MDAGADKREKNRKRPRNNTSSEPRNKLVEKYAHGSINFGTKRDAPKKLKKTLHETKQNIIEAATAAGNSEILLQADAGFIEMDNGVKTFKLKQKDLRNHVDKNTSRNIMDLRLTNFGPYRVNYSRNGRHMIFSGSAGHVATMDCHKSTVGMELQLGQDVYDAKFLHNETFLAVAQQRYTYIYDAKGVELHCMRRHERPYRLDFLPYHYLLTTIGHSGWIKWHDVSTGEYVTGHSTGHGPARVLKHNPINAVSHVGHSNGVVSLWSPASGKALVSMFCHKSPVSDVAVDNSGRYMATAGLDGFMKVWDLRKYACIHAFKPRHPALSLDISDRGLLAMAVGREVQVLREAFTRPVDVTYLQHEVTCTGTRIAGEGAVASKRALASSISVQSVKFRPFEDVLAIGHSHGVGSIVVPGAGEPNFDSFEANPFANPKQRREGEIQTLLGKLSHEMIGIDSQFVGTVDRDQESLRAEQQEVFFGANEKVVDKKDKHRARGRSKISAKLRRKQKNVVDAQTIKLRDQLRRQQEESQKKEAEKEKQARPLRPGESALKRFL